MLRLPKRGSFAIGKRQIENTPKNGRKNAWSDIDLCVVSPQFGKNRFEERVRLMKLSIGAGENIEPHPYNPKDLENKWDSLASEINKYGVEVPL